MRSSLFASALLATTFCAGAVLAHEDEANKDSCDHPVAPAKATSVDGNVEKFGAAIQPAGATALSAVLADPEAYANKPVLVDGYVRKACNTSGCWMEVSTSADAKGQGARVTFKDYGFFIPKKSAGATAKIQGTVTVKTLPKNKVDHLEGEGATFTKKFPDGTAREIQIVATGIELKDRPKS